MQGRIMLKKNYILFKLTKEMSLQVCEYKIDQIKRLIQLILYTLLPKLAKEHQRKLFYFFILSCWFDKRPITINIWTVSVANFVRKW